MILMDCRQFSSAAGENEVYNGTGDGSRCQGRKVSVLYDIFLMRFLFIFMPLPLLEWCQKRSLLACLCMCTCVTTC